jgi:hypothetical protein
MTEISNLCLPVPAQDLEAHLLQDHAHLQPQLLNHYHSHSLGPQLYLWKEKQHSYVITSNIITKYYNGDNAHKIVVRKTEWMTPLGRLSQRCEDYIIMDMDWIHLAQDRVP